MRVEDTLRDMNITLPRCMQPVANYVSVQRSGNLLFLSGAGPIIDGEIRYQGKLGRDLTVEEGYDAARLTAINIIATLKNHLGDLSRVKQIVKLLGFVAGTETFFATPAVINGASDLLVAVFGEKGKHARSAVAVAALPMDTPVEIEAIVAFE